MWETQTQTQTGMEKGIGKGKGKGNTSAKRIEKRPVEVGDDQHHALLYVNAMPRQPAREKRWSASCHQQKSRSIEARLQLNADETGCCTLRLATRQALEYE